MPGKLSNPNNQMIATLLSTAAIALAGCAVTLPPASASNPADPNAPAAATAPLRPTLVATSRSFLSSHADDREQKGKEREIGQMKMEEPGMTHGAPGKPDIAKSVAVDSYYTCPMHPEIHESKPGQCPKCGMTLVKKISAPEGAKP